MLSTTSNYDDALERFHCTGPEFDGYLSNHGPMVIEILERHGQDGAVQGWTDRYLSRLDEMPRPTLPVTTENWRDAIGNVRRTADWVAFFTNQLTEMTWRSVLAIWWPRLLPGIAAGATHGVIRLGHAASALDALETEPRLAELAHALGYWAARWQAVPLITPRGGRPALTLMAALPRVPDQRGGIRDRLAQLDHVLGWGSDVAALSGVDDVADIPARLAAIVEAAVMLYPRYAHGNPTMLVHSATAPNAVLRTLPLLPPDQWNASLAAAWSASAAVVSAYAPAAAAVRIERMVPDAEQALEAALEHGGEHIIKFTDTALSVHARSGDPKACAAVMTAIQLDA